jgi:hypothetical protein
MFRTISRVFCCILVVQMLASCTPTGKVGKDVYPVANNSSFIDYESLLAIKERSKSKTAAKNPVRILVAKNTVADLGYNRGENSTFGFIKNIYKSW